MIYPCRICTEKLVPAFRWRDGLFVQEFDSEITLCRKVLKAQAKFYGWEAGIHAIRFSSVCHHSRSVANSFRWRKLARLGFFVRFHPLAACCCQCRRDVTRSDTRWSRLPEMPR